MIVCGGIGNKKITFDSEKDEFIVEFNENIEAFNSLVELEAKMKLGLIDSNIADD